MLAQLIAECSDYDFKREVEISKPKSWLKSVSVFANGVGGSLYFGVNDNGVAIGLQDVKASCDKIRIGEPENRAKADIQNHPIFGRWIESNRASGVAVTIDAVLLQI